MALENPLLFTESDLIAFRRLRDEAGRLGQMVPLSEPEPLLPPILSLAPAPLVAVVGARWSGKTTLCRRLIGDTSNEPEATLSVADHLLHFHAASPSLLPSSIRFATRPTSTAIEASTNDTIANFQWPVVTSLQFDARSPDGCARVIRTPVQRDR